MRKDEVIRYVERMTYSEKMQILNFLHLENIKIVENGEGCMINLDKIEDVVYDKLIILVETISQKQIEPHNQI